MLLYGKQQLFEYCDKPGKQLARILSEYTCSHGHMPVVDTERNIRQSTTEKLEAFRDYFQKLYDTEMVN